MSVRAHFTDDEWNMVVQTPMLSGLAITAADPGGLWGAVLEAAAVGRSLAEARTSSDSSSLLMTICEALETPDGRRAAQDGVKELLRGKKPAEAADAAVARVGEVADMVAAKVPDQDQAYKEFLRATAQRVAKAAKEGGFLGFGGERVSDAERKTLADLDAALGL